MSQPKFPIPPEFQDQVRYIDALDNRSDEDILTSLCQHQPVTSEKNIWAYWHSGIRKVPSWCKRNIISWVRINGGSWTVRVIDSVPDSPNNALKYLPATILPDSFVTGTMTGPFVGPHSADFLRGACLTLYGGVFLDVGIILINSLDKICWNHLSSTASPYNIAVPVMYGQTIANHFVAARKGDPFIRRWHELFVTLWKDRKDYQGLIGNPLVAFAQQTASFDDSRASNFHWDFSVPAQTVFEYITQVICWQRLCMLEPPDGATGEDAFNCTEYWQRRVLVFDVLKENWGGEELLGFSNFGQKAIDRLSVPISANPDSREFSDASAFVWRLLTRSSMQKVTHGKGLTNDVSLGTLLDKAENEDKDCATGTFAELLRYGCVHFEQTRPEIELMQATPAKVTMKKGVLEP